MIDRQKGLGIEDCTVLDMCCGKGGDIQKWLKSNSVGHVVFADIAETSVQHCQERYNGVANGQRNHPNKRFRQSVFSAQFITADCTKVSKNEGIFFKPIALCFCSRKCFEDNMWL